MSEELQAVWCVAGRRGGPLGYDVLQAVKCEGCCRLCGASDAAGCEARIRVLGTE